MTFECGVLTSYRISNGFSQNLLWLPPACSPYRVHFFDQRHLSPPLKKNIQLLAYFKLHTTIDAGGTSKRMSSPKWGILITNQLRGVQWQSVLNIQGILMLRHQNKANLDLWLRPHPWNPSKYLRRLWLKQLLLGFDALPLHQAVFQVEVCRIPIEVNFVIR